MQRAELVELLSELQKMLLLNKEAFPLDKLSQVDDLIAKIKEPSTIGALTIIFGDSVESLLTSLGKVLEIEKKMLQHEPGQSSMTDRLHAAMENLKHRPIILSGIATFI